MDLKKIGGLVLAALLIIGGVILAVKLILHKGIVAFYLLCIKHGIDLLRVMVKVGFVEILSDSYTVSVAVSSFRSICCGLCSCRCSLGCGGSLGSSRLRRSSCDFGR